MTVAQTSAVNRPTRVRWAIMACVTMVTVLTYLDRLNLAIAGKYIQDELSLSTHTRSPGAGQAIAMDPRTS